MFPTSYPIGALTITPNVVLAPMEGVTDLTFRRLIRQIGGVGLTCTEFVPSASLGATRKLTRTGFSKLRETVTFDDDERPVAIQLYGRDPALMARGAQVVQELGADVVDINMGCPSKSVCKNSGGSALMKDPALAREIVRQVVAAVDVPVTVKMRSGFDATNRNAPEIAWICQEEGAQAVAIHWRTRADKYRGDRQVDKIAEAKARLSIPVLANGDVVDPASAVAMLQETGADGVMVGRGAIRNPWTLLHITQTLRGEPLTQVTASERERVMLAYLDGMFARSGLENMALARTKMLAKHYTRGLPQGDVFKKRVHLSFTMDDARAEIVDYFGRLRAHEAGAAPWHDYTAPVYVRPKKNRAI